MPDPFDSPKLLVSHAREQIEDAAARMRAFFNAKPYARVVDVDPDTGQEVHKIRLTTDLPVKISVVAKDAAGNLRDALDHALYGCALVVNGGAPKNTGFPFARNSAGVAGELGSKRLSGNPPEIHPLLVGFKPHEGGNDLLWGLNSIRNPNSHRVIVPVGQAMMTQGIGIKQGKINGPSRIGYSDWNPAKNEVEFLRLGPGSTIHYEVNATFDVVFEGGNALSGQPVISTLHAITREVERVVLAVEAETHRIVRSRP